MRFLLLAILFTSALCAAAPAEEGLLRRTQVIPLEVQGRIDHLSVDIDSKRLYVAALGNDTVEVIDLASGQRVQSIAGLKEPQGVAVVPASGKLLVASGQDSKCRVYDRSLKLLGTIDKLDDADNVRIDAGAKRAYVGYGDGALAVIDPDACAVFGTIKLDGHPESFQLESAGPRIFVNVPSAKQVAVVDRSKRAVIAVWPIKQASSNFPMALDEPNHRLLIACRKPAKLLAIDTESGKTVAAVDCCGDADDVFYDSANRRVYVTGGDGTISVFAQRRADQYDLAETVKSAAGARTSLFVPSLGKLFVAVPHRGSQPAGIWVYDVTPAADVAGTTQEK